MDVELAVDEPIELLQNGSQGTVLATSMDVNIYGDIL